LLDRGSISIPEMACPLEASGLRNNFWIHCSVHVAKPILRGT